MKKKEIALVVSRELGLEAKEASLCSLCIFQLYAL